MKHPKTTTRSQIFKTTVFLIFFMILGAMHGIGQTPAYYRDYRPGVVANLTIVSDTVEVIIFDPKEGNWRFEYRITKNTDSLLIIPRSSMYGTIYTLYSGLDTIVYTSNTFVGAIEEVSGWPASYLDFTLIATDTVVLDSANYGVKYLGK